MNQKDIIYWAGLFDGEGYMGIIKRKPTKPNPYGQYILQASITQRFMPEPPIEEFGGEVYPDKSSKTYKWMLNTTPLALRFLHAIYPYLRVKKRQAEVAFEFGNLIQTSQRRTRLTQEEEAKRDELMAQLKALKQGKLL